MDYDGMHGEKAQDGHVTNRFSDRYISLSWERVGIFNEKIFQLGKY